MLVQSHEGVIDLLPALPDEWSERAFEGVCARGGFELTMKWKDGEITRVEVLSKYGNPCRINEGGRYWVTRDGKSVRFRSLDDGSISFKTTTGGKYALIGNDLG